MAFFMFHFGYMVRSEKYVGWLHGMRYTVRNMLFLLLNITNHNPKYALTNCDFPLTTYCSLSLKAKIMRLSSNYFSTGTDKMISDYASTYLLLSLWTRIMPKTVNNVNAPSKHQKNVCKPHSLSLKVKITPFEEHILISSFTFVTRLQQNINYISL